MAPPQSQGQGQHSLSTHSLPSASNHSGSDPTHRHDSSAVPGLPTHLARPSNPLATPHTFPTPGHLDAQGGSISNGTGLLDNTFPFPSPAPAATSQPATSAFPAFPSQGLYDWPTNPFLANPSSLLTTCPDGSLAIDATAFGWNGQLEPSTTDLWDDFDHIFSSSGQESAVPNHAANQSRVLFLNNERPTRQGVSLAEMCESKDSRTRRRG